MNGEEKNLKDLEQSRSGGVYGTGTQNMSIILPYTKTNKLITALYMVTDIMDKEEPLRSKLRTLGTNIISDIYLIQQNHVGHMASTDACSRISEIMSFLDIAGALNFISEMNSNILKKEFLELKQSIKVLNPDETLSEFFKERFPPLPNPISPRPSPLGSSQRRNLNSKGHTRIGVQKGHTLMQALNRVEVSNKFSMMSNRDLTPATEDAFYILKRQRRDEIIKILELNPGGLTITDIRSKVQALPADKQGTLASCSEKTLQRELISMVKDGVLNKTGEKRWSRYFIKN